MIPKSLTNPFLSSWIFAFLLCHTSFGQSDNPRFEVGRRLVEMEKNLEKNLNQDSLKKICPILKPLTFQFFAGQMESIARSLDQANRAISNNQPPSQAELFADSLCMAISPKWIASDSSELSIGIQSFYKSTNSPSLHAELICESAQEKVWHSESIVIKNLPLKMKIKTTSAPSGKSTISLVLKQNNLVIKKHSYAIWKEDKNVELEKNLAIAKQNKTNPIISSSISYLETLQKDCISEKKFETEMNLELIPNSLKALGMSKESTNPSIDLEILLAFPSKYFPRPARLFVPSKSTKEKRPLVVALHGAQATENMFFEAYGAGKLVKLCAKEQWFLLAPRNGLDPKNLDDLASQFNIDTNQVYILGHSMGAAQALAFAVSNRDKIKGLGLFGGAGTVSNNHSLAKLPIFVAVGSEDFTFSSVKRFVDQVKKQPENIVLAKELPNVEHITICQAALEDCISFFKTYSRK